MTLTCLDLITEAPVLTCEACGKINLILRIGKRRSDGYHELQSLAVGVAVHDRISLVRRVEPGIHVRCAEPALMTQKNLAVRACVELARRCGVAPALEIELVKRIPIAGGMGGGSSDAAAALRLANRLWDLGLADSDLAEIGAVVGSDVPLFFALPVAEMSGRGEIVQARRMLWSGWALLVMVNVPVPTAEVYAAFDAGAVPQATVSFEGAISTILSAQFAAEFDQVLFNDLEPAVWRVAPVVGEVHRAIEMAKLGPFRISGAGSTLFRLFDTSEAAQDIAHRIAKLDLGVRSLIAAVPTGHGLID